MSFPEDPNAPTPSGRRRGGLLPPFSAESHIRMTRPLQEQEEWLETLQDIREIETTSDQDQH